MWTSLVAQKVKNLPAMQEPTPRSGQSPGEENAYPLQYACLGNPMDRGGRWATVCGFTKSGTLGHNIVTKQPQQD